MKTRGIIVLICLFVCVGMVFADGGGAFTIGSDAGYSAAGSYTTSHTIVYSGTNPNKCAESIIIPDWYDIQSGMFHLNPNSPYNCIKNNPVNSTDNTDFDSDGCTNLQEYNNYLCLTQSTNCNENSMNCAYTSPKGICSKPNKPVACSAELTATCEGNGVCANPFTAPSWCSAYCRHLNDEGGVDAIPEFNGTAIILLALSVIIFALLQGHFHKK